MDFAVGDALLDLKLPLAPPIEHAQHPVAYQIAERPPSAESNDVVSPDRTRAEESMEARSGIQAMAAGEVIKVLDNLGGARFS